MALEIEFTKEIAGICPLPFVILSNTFPSPSHHHHHHHHQLKIIREEKKETQQYI
jgi:hypothetical protein